MCLYAEKSGFAFLAFAFMRTYEKVVKVVC